MKKVIITILSILSFAVAASSREMMSRGKRLADNGNWKDAYKIYSQIAVNRNSSDSDAAVSLQRGITCLRRLNRIKEFDTLIEDTAGSHPKGWKTLEAVAKLYMHIEHFGFIIGGEFERGMHRGGGRSVNSYQRDRVKGLRFYEKSLKYAGKQATPSEVYYLCMEFANAVMYNRGYSSAWRLQYLTNLNELPDYDEGGGYYQYGGGSKGAPVNSDGTPVFYYVPDSLANVANDGERWRYLLNRAMEVLPERKNGVLTQYANFLASQFSVSTMAYGNISYGNNDFEKDKSGPYAVFSLNDSETIAKLATGIKRFTLPDEFNFIKIFRKVAESKEKSYGEPALRSLATIYTNRRQYKKAAEVWRESIKRFGPGIHNRKERSLDQIVGNWGRFDPLEPGAAGEKATFEYRFRNADSVTFEAYRIKSSKLLADVKEYLKSNPKKLKWEMTNLGNIGYRLVHENQKQYIGEKVAEWKRKLTPDKNHFDKQITVTSPISEAGAYLLSAKLADGNISRIVVWLNDTVIVKKQLDNKVMLFIADAATGAPVKNAKIDLFGYQQKYVGRKLTNAYSRQYDISTKEHEVTGGDNGVMIFDPDIMKHEYRWLITATDDKGRFGYLGFQSVWYGEDYKRKYNKTKTFFISDRPVYRPGQKVNFKFWVRHTKYDSSDTSDFAGRVFSVEIRDSRNEKVYEKSTAADKFGGVAGNFTLKSGAALGNYHIFLKQYGGGNFRVEEYKKPEYEVTVEAPKEPVKLGKRITAVIKAQYYFGAPVIEAKVKYKVLRTQYNKEWFPAGPWDWMYGNGYWWFAEDYEWFPGFRKWGCCAPFPWWGARPQNPPEIVMENEVEIGKDGTVKVEIDSSVARELFGDSDQKYKIVAEVVDKSRRSIIGEGSVIAAEKPFKVTVWVNRGYYRVGDTVSANFAARTVDGKPVRGGGLLKLFRITYNSDGKPEESEVQKWKLDTSEEGTASLQIKASEPGQYRLSYRVTDQKWNSIEGGYIFSICGSDKSWSASSEKFRFNAIELINDKKTYSPGDKLNLMINTERSDSFVLLFLRPSNGFYPKPQIIHLKGKTLLEAIDIEKRDMPNFFIEALTVSDGKVHTVLKEILVPPEKRILNVEVLPLDGEKDKKSGDTVRYRPGEKAKVKIRITDFFGKPLTSSAVVTVYDKAVEYISGGSNVSAIKPFFWKWRRNHTARTISNVQMYFHNLLKKGELSMRNLGIFGNMTTNNLHSEDNKDSLRVRGRSPVIMKSMNFAMKTKSVMSDSIAGESVVDIAPVGGAGKTAVHVRTKFADTAYWSSSVTPDKDGVAEIEIDMPENLTTWKIRVWAMADGTKVGEGETEVITSKDLIVRLQSPRFFVEKDEVTLSAVVHNYLPAEQDAKISLKLGGDTLKLIDPSAVEQSAVIPKNGEVRINWQVKAVKEGEAVIQMSAVTGSSGLKQHSDAMEMKFPVLVHGILKQIPFTGSISANLTDEEAVAKFAINVPEERRVEESSFELRYSPTLAGAMVDALPYLVSYPYGCTEQTLNRFLPTVITRKIVKDMGVDFSEIRRKRTNLNALEIGDDKERAAGWKRRDVIIGHNSDGSPIYSGNPVFDEKLVDDMIAEGVAKLRSMQNSDGGWGWFSGWGEESYPHTTSVVVHGLQTARRYGTAVPDAMLKKGVAWLVEYQKEEVAKLANNGEGKEPSKVHADNLDALVFMVLNEEIAEKSAKKRANIKSMIAAGRSMLSYLYRDRNHLSVYGKCTLGIGICTLLKNTGVAKFYEDLKSEFDMIMNNISQYLVKDDENQTAYLNLGNESYWWYWYGSEYEAQAYYLKLLVAADPKDKTAPWLVKYLLNNRKHSTYWNSTRDTAVCLEAFGDYIKATGEDKPDMTLEILFDGKVMKSVKINRENLFSFDNKFILNGKDIKSGKHICEIRRKNGDSPDGKGKGPVYWNAYFEYFSLENFITKAGLEIKVQRKYYKLEKVEKIIKVQGVRGQALDQKVEKFVRHPLANLATLKSGDLVEIELVMESKNDYEYLLFEDMKPAGFEPCEVRSGYNGNDMGAFVEFRDEKVCFFVRKLARGRHSLSYRMRAEVPGKFSALPTKGSAMYAPELKANSDEIKLKVED
jgi:uncharacterized protein YfaS (alpha-2-macroglobulin family)